VPAYICFEDVGFVCRLVDLLYGEVKKLLNLGSASQQLLLEPLQRESEDFYGCSYAYVGIVSGFCNDVEEECIAEVSVTCDGARAGTAFLVYSDREEPQYVIERYIFTGFQPKRGGFGRRR